MASISKHSNGRRTIQFIDRDGTRKSIRLGKISKRMAEGLKFRIEQLNASSITGHAPDPETARWIMELKKTMTDKLVKVGLIPEQDRQSGTRLGTFLADYLTRRIDVKPATQEVWKQVIRNLLTHFGKDRELSSITEGDAEDFKLFLLAEKLASTTVHKRLQFARMFFKDSLKRKIIHTNPFADVSSKAVIGTNRRFFVTRDAINQVLEVCNPTWRLIVCLARFGGLRCPSEVLSLRWDNIDWGKERIAVQAPKTEHHPGKGSRIIPLFPELKEVLAVAFETAPEGAEYVVGGGYREASLTKSGWRNCNLRTQFERLVRRAGLEPWPRLFHALRASRETELAKEYPIHVFTAWLGNTPRIAMKHYLQVTDADFEQAIQPVPNQPGTTCKPEQKGAAKSGAPALQNPVQHTRAASRSNSQETTQAPDQSGAYANLCNTTPVGAPPSSGEDRIRTCGPVAGSPI